MCEKKMCEKKALTLITWGRLPPAVRRPQLANGPESEMAPRIASRRNPPGSSETLFRFPSLCCQQDPGGLHGVDCGSSLSGCPARYHVAGLRLGSRRWKSLGDDQ